MNIDLELGVDDILMGVVTVFVGFGFLALYVWGWLDTKSRRQVKVAKKKGPRISGLDLFEMPEAMRREKDKK